MNYFKTKPEILILGWFPFPNGNACSNYVLGMGKAIRAAGYSVGYLVNSFAGGDDRGEAEDGNIFDGFPYYVAGQTTFRSSFFNYANEFLTLNNALLKWIKNSDLSDVKYIVTYSGTCSFLLELKSLCDKNGIKMVNIVVEWYGSRGYKSTVLSAAWIDNELQMRLVNKLVKNVVCVSTYLYDYYYKNGCNTILLPPLIDLQDAKWKCAAHIPDSKRIDVLRLMFSGSFGRDRQDLILEAIRRIADRGQSVILEYLGSSRNQMSAFFKSSYGAPDSYPDNVKFHGRVSDDDVCEIVASAHFGVLFRENKRWSKACFPSKVPEFLALGVPIIGNLTSDLGEYLVDNENAIITSNLSAESLVTAIDRALQLTPDRFAEMRSNARKTGERFDYGRYSHSIAKFIEGI